jgi:hypothetical protein
MSFDITDLEFWQKVLAILVVLVGAVLYLWPRILRFLNEVYSAKKLSKIKDQLPSIANSIGGRSDLYQMVTEVQKVKKRSETHGILEQIEEATQIEAKLKSKLRYHIRIHPIAFSQDKETKDRFASLILKQNTLQSLFQFELGHCKDPDSIETQITEISGIQNGSFIERFEGLFQKSEIEQNTGSEDITRIIITNNRLPQNFILLSHSRKPANWYNPPHEKWGIYEPNRFYVVSLATFWTLHPDIPVEQFLLRQIQRICMRVVIPSTTKDNKMRMTHVETRGCLFDFIPYHYDARYFTNLAFICEDCVGDILESNEIPEGYRKGFLDQFQQWLNATLPNKLDAF